MQRTTEMNPGQASGNPDEAWAPGRFFLSLIGLVIVLAILWFGFIFLRDNTLPQIINAVIAILWGVGGIAALFTVANLVVEALPVSWTNRIQPYI